MHAAAVTAVLVHSPFLGPASMRPLADALAAHGLPVVLLDLRPSVVTPPVHQVLVGAFEDAISDAAVGGPVVLIGHSGAGPLLPAFADHLEDAVVGLVLLDSELPTPGKSWRDLNPELYAQLRGLARDGQLPRWPHWWDGNPVAELVADEDLRAEILDEAPEVPLAFLKEVRQDLDWTGPGALVVLSPAYEPTLAQAAARGWLTRRLDLDHLAPATTPEPVAQAIMELLNEL